MKKVFIIISLAVLSSCSVKTNEEKARELIDPDIKSHLIKPESYEIAEIYLDSCFSDDIKYNPDIITCSIKLATSYNEYKKHMVDAEMAESSMNLYTSSYGRMEAYTEQHRKKYKAEMEKARRKADTAKQKILQLYRSSVELAEKVNDDKHEFSGWIAFIAYRAETAGGMKTMNGGLYFLNKDLSKILTRFTEEDKKILEEADFDEMGYEFEEELSELFGEDERHKSVDALGATHLKQ